MAEVFAVEFNGFGWQTVYPEKWAENSGTFTEVRHALADMTEVVYQLGDEANTPQGEDNAGVSFYAVSGRMWGDDEATTLVLRAKSREDAVAQFGEAMWALSGCSPEQRERLEDCSDRVFVDAVLQSDTVIREV